MAVFECPKCHITRSRARQQKCPVCWLLADLLIDHIAGFHRKKAMHGCQKCGPRLRAEMRPKSLLILSSTNDARTSLESSGAIAQRAQSTSHASCGHERTSKARAQCRAKRRRLRENIS